MVLPGGMGYVKVDVVTMFDQQVEPVGHQVRSGHPDAGKPH